MGTMSLAPGFRFHPTDVELVKYYLTRKVLGKRLRVEAMAEVDIYKFAPWDLPDKSLLRTRDLKWYFICPRNKKYASGSRLKRTTEFGYWKTTGKDRPVHFQEEVAGMIKTLVFHEGKAPAGTRTNWVMHEYRLEDKNLAERNVAQDAYMLCVVFKKDGLGPRNGAQYGAPFKEEDWSDEDVADDDQPVITAGTSAHKKPNNHMNSQPKSCISCTTTQLVIDTHPPVKDTDPPVKDTDPPIKDTDNASMLMEAPELTDNVFAMFGRFRDDGIFASSGIGQNEESYRFNNGDNVEEQLQLDGNDIYDGLMDLDDLGKANEVGSNMAGSYASNGMGGAENVHFIELRDLDAPLYSPSQGAYLDQIPLARDLADYSYYNTSEHSSHLFDPCTSTQPHK